MAPLTGMKVIELEGIGPGPQTGCILADFGAEVIVVSRVVNGKLSHQGLDSSRGKKSIALDLKSPGGMEAMRALVKSADVLFEPFRPGVTEKMGLGPKEMLELNPKLIYGRLTGYGQGGDPKVEKDAGHDANYLALAGTLDLFKRGDPNDAANRPSAPANYAGDFAGGGVIAAMGILIALIERIKSGKGQVIDAAMTDGSAYVALPIFKMMLAGDNGILPQTKYGDLDPRYSFIHQGTPYCDAYETKRDPARPDRREFMSFQAIEPQFYRALIGVLGLDKDPDMQNQLDKSMWPVMKLKIQSVVRSKTRDEWAELFRGTDACAAPVLNADEAARHPHNVARGTFVPTPNKPGRFEPAPAPKLSRTPGLDPRPDPTPGADTRTVLKELGLGEAKIVEMFKAGVTADETAERGVFDRNQVPSKL